MAVQARLTAAQGRKFAFTVGIAFIALGTFSWWRGRTVTPLVAWGLGGALLLAGLVAPTHLGPIERAWMRLANLMAKVTTPIMMAIAYLAVLTPMGFVMRIFGRNPLTVHHKSDTTWISRAEGRRRSDLNHPF